MAHFCRFRAFTATRFEAIAIALALSLGIMSLQLCGRQLVDTLGRVTVYEYGWPTSYAARGYHVSFPNDEVLYLRGRVVRAGELKGESPLRRMFLPSDILMFSWRRLGVNVIVGVFIVAGAYSFVVNRIVNNVKQSRIGVAHLLALVAWIASMVALSKKRHDDWQTVGLGVAMAACYVGLAMAWLEVVRPGGLLSQIWRRLGRLWARS